MSHSLAFAPEALAQLDALEGDISETESPVVAARFVDNIISYCASLCVFPLRGPRRDDLLPTLCITHYRHTTAIAFRVAAETPTVSILGLPFGGQDYAARFHNHGEHAPSADA
ncbi:MULTISPECIES: type II toxin-antitoxin system RelE/ParE family toxin [Pseudomonas]|uniref:type II toxin-antitoxin system RelE/ParE family toxin n=1 Tax=Pseudomonas TaxID=286 RepID=UPI00084AA385|nr:MULTISPECIES: type II toxin-antitoxin system RelE/ParE family toxin [Pseudomonas]MBC8786500.1 type II toxin-antitoxin system RelE/ParE family toxin [Pseudomonas fluorescens]MEA3168966.1 toxin ParE1/3/4 [Pseudomonas sp.]OEC68414.1 plasmid stabilization protein [Pseudomonas sp. AP19]OPB06874.1 plasmid stabilization protein [Pseudomonas fluorescens]